jgi:hypothetical protein
MRERELFAPDALDQLELVPLPPAPRHAHRTAAKDHSNITELSYQCTRVY